MRLSTVTHNLVLSPLIGGSLTLTATGGPVCWLITEPASLLGALTVSPSAGTLSAGQSVTITLTASQFASLDSQLTVEPGDQQVTVLLARSAEAPAPAWAP